MEDLLQPSSYIPVTVLSDLVTVMKDKGLKDAEIADILREVFREVQDETIGEIIVRLPEHKQAELDQMVDANASDEEIAEFVGISQDELEQIAAQKLAEIIEEMIPTLEL